MSLGFKRPSHCVRSPLLLLGFHWSNCSPVLWYLMRFSQTREPTSHRGWGISSKNTRATHQSRPHPISDKRKALRKGLIKLWRRCCRKLADTGKDWNCRLLFLLFAYQKVLQAPTSFLTFELMFGKGGQGPFDLLWKRWEVPSTTENNRGSMQYVLEMRDWLTTRRQRSTSMRAREARKPGMNNRPSKQSSSLVKTSLFFLPSFNSKLCAKCLGPYLITHKMTPVKYESHHPVKKKAKQTWTSWRSGNLSPRKGFPGKEGLPWRETTHRTGPVQQQLISC